MRLNASDPDVRSGVPGFRSHSTKVVVLLGLLFTLSSVSRAQWEPVYHLGQDFAKQLHTQRTQIIAVADPWWVNGSSLEPPHYLGVSLDAALRNYGKGKDKLQVLQHEHIHEALTRLHIPLSDVGSAESRKILSAESFVDVIVYGSLESDQTSFKATFSAENVTDGKVLLSRSVSFPKSSFTDCLTTAFPPAGDSITPISKNMQPSSHFTPPLCTHCPIPSYNNLARELGLQGTSIYNVLISEQGQPEGFQLVRIFGYAQDERALEEMKKWKFRPATRDGKPIRIINAIEVTFGLT